MRASRRKREKLLCFRLLSINIRPLAEQGKLVYVASKLSDCEVDVACVHVQETRLRDDIDVKKAGSYSLFTTPASRYKGGLMTMVRDRAGVVPIDYIDSFPRVSRLTIRINGHLLHVVNCHAPITEAPEVDHVDFATQLMDVVNPIRCSGKILVCCDLNARLKGLTYSIIGPMALSECPLGASHRTDVLDLLQSLDLYALNTFAGTESDYTWIHASGALHQIDFVFGGAWFKNAVSAHLLGVWGFFDLATTTDHRHLFYSFEMGDEAKEKRAAVSRVVRFVNTSHQEEFAKAVKQGILDNWDGISTPQAVEAYLSKLVDQAADFMVTFRPHGASPRSPWISADTWNYLVLLNKYRRLSSAMYRGDDSYASLLANSIINHGGAKYFPMDHVDAFDARAEAIRVLSIATRRMLRADRRKRLKDVCASLPRNAETGRVSPVHLHKAVKRLCSDRKSRPGNRLRHADGSIAINREEADKLWMSHSKMHFNGTEVDVTDSEDRTQEHFAA
eukprot:6462612-Amphidinium_carterae.3